MEPLQRDGRRKKNPQLELEKDGLERDNVYIYRELRASARDGLRAEVLEQTTTRIKEPKRTGERVAEPERVSWNASTASCASGPVARRLGYGRAALGKLDASRLLREEENDVCFSPRSKTAERQARTLFVSNLPARILTRISRAVSQE